jgi:dephospho-CoA kinase
MFTGMRPRKEKKVNYSFKKSISLLSPDKRLYKLDCPIIGLTGGIATGKSTVADLFKNKGFPLINADILVKRVYQLPEVQEFIRINWPSVFIGNDINFKLLRNLAFSNIENRTKIEKIIYSHMQTEFLKEYSTFDRPEIVIYDVPLLYEKNLDGLIDYSIVVYAPATIQMERLQSRDKINIDDAKLALSNQMDIEEKKKLCDYVITNDKGLDQLADQVDVFIEKTLLKQDKK